MAASPAVSEIRIGIILVCHDEFLAMLAHELRNPLAPIRTGLELLQAESRDHETIALMQQQVDHLVHLVDDLLDVSRIMRGKIALRKQRVLLSAIFSRAIATVPPLIAQYGRHLLISQPPQPVWLEADPIRLSQVVSNLLHNAAKYTPNGGHITLEVQEEDQQAIIYVRDDGIGIEADFLPELFELFTQADHSLARSVGGLGLGLTLVRRLVALHGGHISAHSEGIGKGSEFALRLPTVRHAERATPDVCPEPQRVPPVVARCRILVVDDNLSSVNVMRRLHGTLWKHEVEIAYDGQEALRVAQAFHPDLIFLDIGLPGTDSFEVARQLRQQPAFAHVLLIALTGYGSEEDHRKSRAAGFDCHLVKPVTAKMLQHAIAQVRSRG